MAPRKSNNPSKSARNYAKNPASKAKKDAYNKEFNKKKSQRKKRSELVQKNREADKRGVDRTNRDYDHKVKGYVSVKTNRGRKGEGGRCKKK